MILKRKKFISLMSKNTRFTKKSRVMFFLAFLIFSSTLIEVVYLDINKSMDEESLNKKRLFVELSGLPDLAIFSQNSFVRHRSLSDIFSIYSNDGTLREYSDATFAISHKEIN